MMRILKLTPALEQKLLRTRQQRDLTAEKIASHLLTRI